MVKRRKKTLILDIEFSGGSISQVVFSGDFFAYPPEGLEELERELMGCPISKVRDVLNKYRGRLELVGVTFDDLREAIEEAIRQSRSK